MSIIIFPELIEHLNFKSFSELKLIFIVVQHEYYS